MLVALYDEEGGFFMQSPRGPGSGEMSDFVTSPEMSPMFGAMIARHAGELWEALGRPAKFDVVEAGGGRGSLAKAFLDGAAYEVWSDSLQYRLVDPSYQVDPGRARGILTRIEVDSGEIEGPVNGLILANELLDNIPERLWCFNGNVWRELLVGLDGENLCMVDGPPASEEVVEAEGLSLCTRAPVTGEIRVGAAGAIQWVKDAAAALEIGELIVIDYSDPPNDAPMGGVRTFAGHTCGADPLESPGERDITLPVNWPAVADAASSCGLHVDALISQAEWLDGLGLISEIDAMRSSEFAAAGSAAISDALRFRDQRMRAISLVDPAGLGAFTVFRARRDC